MKFTKILALVLVLVLALSAFAACGGGGDETKAPEGSNDPADDTTVAPNETQAPCAHPERFLQVQEALCIEPTCIGGLENGLEVVKCVKCGELMEKVIEATHTYSELKSIDGAYTKYACIVCGDDVYVEDASGNKVADYSAIKFPYFAADFEEVGPLDPIEKISYLYEGVGVEDNSVKIVKDKAENNSYLLLPVRPSTNGYISIVDEDNALVAGKYTVSFKVKFISFSASEAINLVTWTIGDDAISLVKFDHEGNVFAAGGSSAGAFSDKGWDTVTVEVDPAAGSVKVSVVTYGTDGTQIATKTATGALGTSVAGKTGSAIKFFDDNGKFEAYLDDISISVE